MIGQETLTAQDIRNIMDGYTDAEQLKFKPCFNAAIIDKDKEKLKTLRANFTAEEMARSNQYVRDRVKIAQCPRASAEYFQSIRKEREQLETQIATYKVEREQLLNDAAKTIATQYGNSSSSGSAATAQSQQQQQQFGYAPVRK